MGKIYFLLGLAAVISCISTTVQGAEEGESKFKCYVCEDCSGDLSDDHSKECLLEVTSGSKDNCFTETKKDGDQTKHVRGCFHDLSAPDQVKCTANVNCKACDAQNCNDKSDEFVEDATTSTKDPATGATKDPATGATKDPATDAPPTKEPTDEEFQCIVCRSDNVTQKACDSKLKDTTFAMKCDLTPLTKDDKACFVLRTDDNVVIRDCMSTATALKYSIDKDKCADSVKGVKCNFCDSQNCNTMEPRNSGLALNGYGSLIAIAAVVITKYF